MTSTSATDTKFIVRFTNCSEMHEKAKEAAKDGHMSLNSFILQAIDEKLGRGAAMDQLLKLVDPEHIRKVWEASQKET